MPNNATRTELFFRKVYKTSDCWFWLGVVTAKTGYGHVTRDHLFLGTSLENHRDRISNGVAAGSNAKLTERDVVEIRRLQREGWLYRELVERFGVCREAVWGIVSGRTWVNCAN